ncbi:MAG: ATP-binding protein [Oscillospiraceae bacterium]|nr:ATP-binding protein [Oscillospiraceae bacterium]
MPLIRLINEKIRINRFPLFQVICVFLAFALMVFFSYSFGRRLEQAHLQREAESMFTNIEKQLYSDLSELDSLLGIISESIRMRLLQPAEDPDFLYTEIKEYIKLITEYGQESGIAGFLSVFAMFDVFGGAGYNGLGWEGAPGYIPEDREWYKVAVAANGEIAYTQPYLDAVSGNITISYARCIFDDEGNRLAIVCIDVLIDRIYEFYSEHNEQSAITWMLLDKNLMIIAHPSPDYLGVLLTEAGYDIAGLEDALEHEYIISGTRFTNYTGESRIQMFDILENGWFLGVSIPFDSYYENMQSMQGFLIAFGFAMSVLLSAILIRMAFLRNRAEDKTRVLLDAVPLCANFWDRDFKNIMTNNESINLFDLSNKKEYIEKFYQLSPKFQPDGSLSGEKALDNVKKAFEEGRNRFEWMHQKLNGEQIPCEITLVRVKYENDYIVAGYTRDLREEKAMLKELAERDKLLKTVNHAAFSLLSMNDADSFELSLLESLELVGRCIDADRVNIWRKGEKDGEPCLFHSYEWVSIAGALKNRVPLGISVSYEEFPDWENVINNGNSMHGSYSNMNEEEKIIFENYGIKSIMMIPLYSQNEFWGLFTIDLCQQEREFSDEEINILRSAALMMVSAVTGSEMFSRISEEREKSEMLAHRYHSILDAIPLPVSVTDADMNWTFVNTALENLISAKRKDIMGKHCSNWNSPICGTENCAITCVKRGIKQTYYKQNDLSYKIDAEILKDLKGETEGYIKIVQNITEVEEMVQKNVELEAVSNAKSAFLTTVSHEIRTPMNTILGIAEIQLQNELLSPKVEEAFCQINDAGDLLLNIINDILDLSKIEAGKLEIVPSKYDMPSLINDTAQLNHIRYESKPIKFFIDLAPNTPMELIGDEFRIRQILNNLLSNAFKYTEKGTVELKIYTEENHSDSEHDLILVFKVSDTGQGMNDEQLAHIFDEFTRFNPEENHGIMGTGLGMSITRRLVDMMNGEITAESEPNKGTVFDVRLPQKSVSSEVCGDETSEKLKVLNFKSRARMKKAQLIREYMPYGSVLIVDDVSLNLQVAKGLMLPYGIKIDMVASGFEAIEKVKNGEIFDIIFMDYMMPKMNGVEATKILREKMDYKEAVVALTANAVVGQEEMFLKNGFDAYISKPIDSRELDVILNDLIRNKKPPEVVEAARKEQIEKELHNINTASQESAKIPEIEKYFLRDAQKAISILEDIHARMHALIDDDDIESYTVTAHGIKSALANIGEEELSAYALKLERAGTKRDVETMKRETSTFLVELKALAKKYKPEATEINVDVSVQDAEYLRKKLLEIKNACEILDKKAAKEILSDLKAKNWPVSVNEALDDIAVHLLHSAFKKAAGVAEKEANLIV